MVPSVPARLAAEPHRSALAGIPPQIIPTGQLLLPVWLQDREEIVGAGMPPAAAGPKHRSDRGDSAFDILRRQDWRTSAVPHLHHIYTTFTPPPAIGGKIKSYPMSYITWNILIYNLEYLAFSP